MAVIFSDNFNRPDNTDLGTNWQEVGGDFAILAGLLRIGVYSAPVQCVYTSQITPSDYTVQAFCHTGTNPKRTPGVFLRGVWNSTTLRYDCYYATVRPNNQTIYLYLYQNGSYTTIASLVDTSIDATGATGYTIKLEAQGNTLKVYVDGVLKITATDSTLTSGGYCGLMASSVRTSIYWDDFIVEDLGGGVVYTEDVGFSQFQLLGGSDIQKYAERLAFLQLAVSQISEIQKYVDRLNSLQISGISETDLQRYIELLSFLQNTGVSVSDLQRYIEQIQFAQLSIFDIRDLQRYLERLTDTTIEVFAVTDSVTGKLAEYLQFVQTQLVTGADSQTYKDRVAITQIGLQTINDLQRYKSDLLVIQSQIQTLNDLQRYIERLFTTTVSGQIVTDLQRYIEALQFATAELIAVTEKFAGIISEQLLILQSGKIAVSDFQRYIEALQFVSGQLFSEKDLQRFLEQLQYGGRLLVSETDLQRYIEKINTNLNQILVSKDLQNYIESIGFTGLEKLSISDIYFSRTPVKPVFVILKLLKLVFEMEKRQTEFPYQGYKKNFFEYGGNPSLSPLKLTTETYNILKSEDDAGQADSTTSTALSTKGIYEWIEAYSNGVQRSAIIFRSVGVVNGLGLKKATLRMYLHAIDDRFGNLHVKALIGDDLPDFAEQDINSRLNSAVAETDIPITGLTAGQWYDFDITNFLQTVFSDVNWKAGYDLCLILEPPAGATLGYLYFHAYDNSSGNRPQLIIDYYETSIYPITKGVLDAYKQDDSSGVCSTVINNSTLLYHIPSAANGRNTQFAIELDANVPNPVKKAELWIYVENYQKLDQFSYIYLMARKKCTNSGYTTCADFAIASDWSDVFTGAGEYVANYLDILKTVNPPGWVVVDITDMLNTVMAQACWGVDGRTISFLFVSSSNDAGEQVVYRASEFGNGQYAPFIKIYK